MTSLTNTIHQQLYRFRSQRTKHIPAEPSPHLGRTVAFGSNPGALTMLSHVPARLAGPAPLVVVLHGCTQTAVVYDLASGWSELADRCGFAVLYPEQSPANNPKRCFNWFQPADTARDNGEAQSIRQMIERLAADGRVDRRRIFITGLSAGGAMAAAMLATYPEVFSGATIIAGLPYRTAGSVQEAFEAMYKGRRRTAQQWGDLVRSASSHDGPWPVVSIWQGTADKTVLPLNADELVKQWQNVHGLDGAVATIETSGRLTRQIWRGPDGVPKIEKNLVAGMGHGAPLDAGSGAPVKGHAGPFMLDVGISSTYQSALAWGLTGPLERAPSMDTAAGVETMSAAPAPPSPQRVEIGAIIARALRAAGLMK